MSTPVDTDVPVVMVYGVYYRSAAKEEQMFGVTNMRFRAERERDLYPKRGLGVWVERGCTGTTYGEDGWNMFASVYVLLGCITLGMHWRWKSHHDS